MRLRTYIAAALGLGMLALTLTFTSAGHVIAQGNNNNMNPLLATIVNTVANPVPVRNINEGRVPFQDTATIFVTGSSGSVETILTVPAGKRLIIESVSAQVTVTPIDSVSALNIITRFAPQGGQSFGTGFHEIQVSQQGRDLSGNSVFAGTHAMRAYADPGTDVQVQFGRSDITNSATAVICVVGYLVDVI